MKKRLTVTLPYLITQNCGNGNDYLNRSILLLFIFLLPCIGVFGQLDTIDSQTHPEFLQNFIQANNLYEKGEYDDAKIIFMQLTTQPVPFNVNHAWWMLGNIYYHENNYDEAINSYKTFINQSFKVENDPRYHAYVSTTYKQTTYEIFTSICERLGNSYKSKGDHWMSIQYYTWGMRFQNLVGTKISEDTFGDLLHGRGDLYRIQGRTEQAINDFKQVMKLKKYYAKDANINSLIQIYDSISKVELYDFLIQLPNKNAEQINKLALTSFQLDKFEEADKYYTEALRLDSTISIDVTARETSQKNVAELRRKKEQERIERDELEELKRNAEEKQRIEVAIRRISEIKNAEVGDKLLYSETWSWKEGFWVQQTGTYSMVVTCFIERKEGDRYQLRVGDVTSSDSRRFSTPTINGVKVSKGDIIWARPLNDSKWVYGKDF